jgi:uncharacterized protein YjbJ (UPF0337 family)
MQPGSRESTLRTCGETVGFLAGRTERNRNCGRTFIGREIDPTREENKMNWDQVQGNWKQFKGKVQEQWGSLTNDDLDKIEGNQERLEGLIQERYGKSREEAKTMVDNWLTRP